MRTLVHSTNRGEENLFPMVRYGQAAGNDAVCKSILLDNLGEPGAPNPTQVQAENDGITTETKDVGIHGQVVVRLVQDAMFESTEVTLPMIIKRWRSKVNIPQYLKDNPPSADNLSVDECERIIVSLLLEQVLQFRIRFTAYSCVPYIELHPTRGEQMAQSKNPKMIVRFPKRQPSSKMKIKPPKVASSGEWLQAKPKTKPKRNSSARSTTMTTTSKKRKNSTAKDNQTTRKRSTTTTTRSKSNKRSKGNQRESQSLLRSSGNEVIELFSDDDSDATEDYHKLSDNDETLTHHHRKQSPDDALWTGDGEFSDDDENEF